MFDGLFGQNREEAFDPGQNFRQIKSVRIEEAWLFFRLFALAFSGGPPFMRPTELRMLHRIVHTVLPSSNRFHLK
jgi:hypothetical protein